MEQGKGDAMRRFDTIAVGGFVSVAVLAVVVGFGTIIYAYAVIEPKINRIDEQAQASTALVERGLRVVEKHSNRFNTLDAPQQSTVDATRKLDAVLEQSAYLSEHAAQTLERTAHTLRSVADATALILPEEAFEQNAEKLSTMARSLTGLAPRLHTLHQEIDTLAGDFAQAAQGTEQLEQTLRRADVTVKRARTQLRQTRQALSTANLPAEITRLISMHGGLYIILGVVLLGIAGIWRQLAQLHTTA